MLCQFAWILHQAKVFPKNGASRTPADELPTMQAALRSSSENLSN